MLLDSCTKEFEIKFTSFQFCVTEGMMLTSLVMEYISMCVFVCVL
jgi:hypothetical protein